jgi:hypothetical protein
VAVLALWVGMAVFSVSEITRLKKELAEAKTQVVEKLVIDHNSIQCNR